MSEEQSNLTPNETVSVVSGKDNAVSQKEQKRSNMRGRWRRPSSNARKACTASSENIGLCTPDPDTNVPENLGAVVTHENHPRRERQEQRNQQQRPPIDLNERRDNGYNSRRNDFEKREFIKQKPLTLWQRVKKFFVFCFRGKTEQQQDAYRGGDKKKFYRHDNRRRHNRFRK